MLAEFENTIADFAEANRLFESADKVLLAVSGGADSTALLYAVKALHSEGAFHGELLCAHINHQLRGPDSDADEDFAVEQASKLNLSITTKRLEVRAFARKNKLSTETAARKLRLKSLVEIAAAGDCQRIATAHHKDDNAETVLQRLARGTGFRGLAGIWPKRRFAEGIDFISPLLSVNRSQIIKYLKEQNLKWRTDHTNADCTYRRNFIRHRLLPSLQNNSSGSLVEQLSDLSRSAQRFYKLICDSAETVWPDLAYCTRDTVVLDLESFSAQPPEVKAELIRRSLACLGSGQKNLTQRHFQTIYQLAQQNTGTKTITLPDGFRVAREYGKLIFAQSEKIAKPRDQNHNSVTANVPGQTRFGKYLINAAVFDVAVGQADTFKAVVKSLAECFDLDKLNLPLEIHFRRTAERFMPLGLTQEKKIGKFLTDQKVPHTIRKELLIVADSDKIIWLWPIRISEQAKITAETKKILRLRITVAGKDKPVDSNKCKKEAEYGSKRL